MCGGNSVAWVASYILCCVLFELVIWFGLVVIVVCCALFGLFGYCVFVCYVGLLVLILFGYL